MLFGLAVLALAGGWAYRGLTRPFSAWDGASVTVVLEPGIDAGTMLARLADAGVVEHPRLARGWIAWRGGAARLHAGEYRFDRPLAALDVLERLERGDVVLHPVTLPEGLTIAEVAARFVEAGFGASAELLQAFADPAPILDLDPQAEDLEGYLFPDTYHFPQGERPGRIAPVLVRRFRNAVGEGYAEAAGKVGLTLRQAVVLASMIEEETSVGAERARISQVFHNRIKRGMRMECDPTVMYALARAGRPVTRLSRKDLRFQSPWNTYVSDGLPPGPISSPGLASLQAAVNPSEGQDLYFVAAPGGGHQFSRSLSGHLKAVAAWRRHVRSSR